ncbi:smad/FHA domain protein [Medicago truncatula]|uniref:Smad/FHA domain protein n=1 Tax=Medicago truncatula TaxID=3880 RepID=A0A072UXC2_MEDTR|nr:smad/FHA domain protein [Medicago truncatula]
MGRHSPSTRRHRSHRSISPPPRDKQKPSTRSPDSPPPSSHRSRSPSPRTKRLKKIQSEREPKREHERNRDSNSRGRDSEREEFDRKERRRVDNDDDSGRNGRSSRSKHDRSPEHRHNGRGRHRSQSPQRHSMPRDEGKNSREAEMMNEEDDSLMKMKAAEEALQEKQKVKPSFELSGKLAEETNRVRGITLLFNEPPEARKPDVKWRLYVFKTGEMLNEPLYIHRQSCYLFGRERRVADVPTDHPSCSKQHAVIQFRIVPLNLNGIMNLGSRTPLNLVIVGK